MNFFLVAGSLFGFLAVGIGAFGAHGLEGLITEHALSRYHTGVNYQFYHVIALLLIGVLSPQHQNNKLLSLSGYSFMAGIILFSGSLYLYAFTGITTFGMVTPFGGLAFLAGWASLFFFGLKSTNQKTND